MVRYTSEQLVFLYDPFVKYGSAEKCRRKFRRKVRDGRVPSKQTIHNLVNKLITSGLLLDKKQKHKRRVLTEEGAWLEHTPRISMKRLAQETGVSESSARTETQLLKSSSESWCVCCKCKKVCCSCALFNKAVNCERDLCVQGQHLQHHLWFANLTASFRTLSSFRHADSSAKFVCASQQAAHRSPWNAEPCARLVTENLLFNRQTSVGLSVPPFSPKRCVVRTW
jgi:hypothetical protein